MQEIDEAGPTSFENKKRLAREYCKVIKPKINQILDDVMTASEEMTENLLDDARAGTDATAHMMKDNQTWALMGKRQQAAERAKNFSQKE
jgi:hypothetical protein